MSTPRIAALLERIEGTYPQMHSLRARLTLEELYRELTWAADHDLDLGVCEETAALVRIMRAERVNAQEHLS